MFGEHDLRTRLTLPLSDPKRTCHTPPIMSHLRKSEVSDCPVGEIDVVIQKRSSALASINE
jgi:hypothetical protein